MNRPTFGPTWALIEQAYDSFIEDIGCEPKLIEVALDVWRKLYEEYPSKPQIEGGFRAASWLNTPIITRIIVPPGKIYVRTHEAVV